MLVDTQNNPPHLDAPAKVLEIANLGKRFGDLWALQEVSFALERGEVFGLLGPNGAGKTTTTSA
jgi:ABC-type multidrug transport system ATPase subunit